MTLNIEFVSKRYARREKITRIIIFKNYTMIYNKNNFSG